MTGDAIDAATAADWGLINKAVAPDRLEAETRDLIERATRGSALSKALGKQAFYRQVDLPQDDAYDFAVERMASASLLPDAQESVAAFLEKRPPALHPTAHGGRTALNACPGFQWTEVRGGQCCCPHA
jgi:enoyl-CoA hydratase/carnithine racemase